MMSEVLHYIETKDKNLIPGETAKRMR